MDFEKWKKDFEKWLKDAEEIMDISHIFDSFLTFIVKNNKLCEGASVLMPHSTLAGSLEVKNHIYPKSTNEKEWPVTLPQTSIAGQTFATDSPTYVSRTMWEREITPHVVGINAPIEYILSVPLHKEGEKYAIVCYHNTTNTEISSEIQMLLIDATYALSKGIPWAALFVYPYLRSFMHLVEFMYLGGTSKIRAQKLAHLDFTRLDFKLICRSRRMDAPHDLRLLNPETFAPEILNKNILTNHRFPREITAYVKIYLGEDYAGVGYAARIQQVEDLCTGRFYFSKPKMDILDLMKIKGEAEKKEIEKQVNEKSVLCQEYIPRVIENALIYYFGRMDAGDMFRNTMGNKRR